MADKTTARAATREENSAAFVQAHDGMATCKCHPKVCVPRQSHLPNPPWFLSWRMLAMCIVATCAIHVRFGIDCRAARNPGRTLLALVLLSGHPGSVLAQVPMDQLSKLSTGPTALVLPPHAQRQLAVTHVPAGSGTLQTAVNNAAPGDTLVLGDGVYTGSGDDVLRFNKSLTIRAANLGQAVIDGQNARRGIRIDDGTVLLEGLNISDGKTTRTPVRLAFPDNSSYAPPRRKKLP